MYTNKIKHICLFLKAKLSISYLDEIVWKDALPSSEDPLPPTSFRSTCTSYDVPNLTGNLKLPSA